MKSRGKLIHFFVPVCAMLLFALTFPLFAYGAAWNIMPVPSGQASYTYSPVSDPVFSAVPSQAKPVGLGPVAQGGDTVTIKVGFNQFSGAVDMYGAYVSPADPLTVQVLNSEMSFQAFGLDVIVQALSAGQLPAGIEPWRESITGPLSETLFSFPVSSIQEGIYNIYLLVTPADSLQDFYLWTAPLWNSVYQLTVNTRGSGTVESFDGFISCGSDCSELYGDGTAVTLQAFPAAGYSFDGWDGCDSAFSDTCQITMNTNRSVTGAFRREGLNGPVEYTGVLLTWNGQKYEGALSSELISASQGQKFYTFTRPADCTEQIQVWLAGNVITEANVNLLVSDTDFGTTGEALAVYQDFLSTTGYGSYTETSIGGTTYWYWFSGSYESEFVPIFNPSSPEYYVEVVNEEDFTAGLYRISVFCW